MNFHLRLFSLCCVAALSQTAFASDQVFVTNEGSSSVSVIDSKTNSTQSTIDTGGKPRGLALCKNDAHLYVSNQKDSQLQAIDTRTGKINKTLTLGDSPEAVSCSPDGKWLAIANEGSNSVSFASTTDWKIAFDIAVQGKNPEHAVFSPDGQRMLVSAEEADQVDVLDLRTRKQVASIRVGNRPRGIAFSPDGNTAYVAVETDSLLVRLICKHSASKAAWSLVRAPTDWPCTPMANGCLPAMAAMPMWPWSTQLPLLCTQKFRWVNAHGTWPLALMVQNCTWPLAAAMP